MTGKSKKKGAVSQGDLFSMMEDPIEQKEDEQQTEETGDLFAEPAAEPAVEPAVAEETVPAAEAVVEEVAEPAEETVEAVAAETREETVKSHTDIVEETLSFTEDSQDSLTLAHFASKAYLEYAISVVKGRALPDLCDGQKPVQRRILYAMRRMGLTPDAKQVKSARVVGDVLGKYHPHGDSAAYEAMVRMAQPFTMRYPLVDGHGNFGSRDGDGAAAMRYTEAKLTKFSELLLSEIDDGTVNFIPNYDGAFKEPVVLPARMPFMLLNGSSGIAVGMATEIPSHNMREVANAVALLIEKPEATLEEVLEVMPGPDLPGGSQIISSRRDIIDVYRTGYGSLQMRAFITSKNSPAVSAFKEPVVLPARMPFMLLNGSSGIAVGMATEIPSHNMREVANAVALLIEKPEATLEEVLEVMPGPDLPGGSQIISSRRDIIDVYRTGYGSLQMRAVYHFEELARGQWQLVVTQLPYKVSTQKVLAEIEALTNPKPPSGKKALTAKQSQEKLLMLNVLDKARDESDKDKDVRLVFEPRSKTVDRQEFVNTLFAKTSLQFNCKFNMISIGRDGKPRQKGIIEILKEWASFRIDTVERRSRHRLEALEDRIHILEGRKLILVSIDEVIRIIRESDDPKEELQAKFALTDRQVEDILEIKLRQLARLEDIRLQKELDEKEKEAKSLRLILSSPKRLHTKVVQELLSDAQKYGDERRTLIEEAAAASVAKKVVDEAVTVVISEKGFVRARSGHGVDAKSMSFKIGDEYLTSFECRSVDHLVLMSNSGRVYSVPVSELPSARGDGTHISAFVQLADGDRPIAWFAGAKDQKLLVTSVRGMGLTCNAGNLVVRQKAGKTFFELESGDEAMNMQPVGDDQCWIAALSETGRMVVFETKEVSARASGGKGVLLIDMQLGEKVVDVIPCTPNGIVVIGKGRGDKIQELSIGPRLIEEFRCKRARKGHAVQAKWQFIGLKQSRSDKKDADESILA